MVDSPNQVFVNTPLTYEITVTNTGPANATGVIVTDTLPTSVVFVSANASQGTWSQLGGVVMFDLGNLANNGSALAG